MNELLKKVRENPLNKKLLSFLKIDFSNNWLHFRNWKLSRSGFDEGGVALFDEFGVNIPIECKYSLDIHNVLIIPNTGEIFAFHTGRYSLFLKCDFEFFGLTNSDKYRKGFTFDSIRDITELGENWAFMDNFSETESETLYRTYEVLKNTKC
ncbi:hypothetical protein [Fulvivirga sediminis]|uniref:Uncharacterized protein n=1 Tax=Fulvivirga sediminis TaxID=2803949 RepID=A0A937F974_9BACT|nr:hypothetical protein [Fulvivirga sediminis]MBL3658641.1 hypothetical protein [Fulvivirga sediminis]